MDFPLATHLKFFHINRFGDFITLLFITSNAHKFQEAREILKPYEIKLEHFNAVYPEIRADDVEEVAKEAAQSLFEKTGKPLMVEDSGLFIDSLNGFPGAYSAWIFGKIGNAGILKLLGEEKERRAYFKSCVAYADSKMQETFCGTVRGTISKREIGSGGFGYDPIFVPEGENRTFAENETLKNKISHRSNAFTDFAKWYSSYNTR